MGVLERVRFGDFGVLPFKGFLGDVGRDDDVDRFFETGVFLKNFEIFFRSKVMGLISVADKIGDENFFGF